MSNLHYRSILIACLLCLPALSAAPAEPERDLARENAQLKTRIEALEKRVDSLQHALDSLHQEMSGKTWELHINPWIPAQPAQPQNVPESPKWRLVPEDEPQNLPELRKSKGWVVPEAKPDNAHPDWKEGQINGVRYYIVPLQNGAVK